MSELSHFDAKGNAHMVDVGDKPSSQRVAVAEAWVLMKPETLQIIMNKNMSKGDVLGVSQLAGIMGAKRTADLIPLCHPLALSSVKLDLSPDESRSGIRIEARVKVQGQTGVEMEALTAVSIAALTVYDMAKAIDKAMRIESIRLLSKIGGKSGTYEAAPA